MNVQLIDKCIDFERGETDSPPVFLIEAEKTGKHKLHINKNALQRGDCWYYFEAGIHVLVIGHPYTLEPLEWLSAEGLHRLYSSCGTSLLKELHGYFILIVEDSVKGRLYIATCRNGGYAVYESESGDALLYSDSIELLAEKLDSLTTDKHALVEFLEFGFFIGDKTHFEEVRKVNSSQLIEISGKGVSAVTYWNLFSDDNDELYERSFFISEFAEQVRNLFLISGTAALSLTAGLDSRAILSCCKPGSREIRGFTVGNKKNYDVKAAGEICKATGFRHTHYPVDKKAVRYSFETYGDLLRRCSGARNCFHFLSFAVPAYISQADHCDSIMTGVGAELYRAFFANGHQGDSCIVDIKGILRVLSMSQGRTSMIFKSGLMDNSIPGILSTGVGLELKNSREEDPLKASEWLYLNSRVANFTAIGPALCGNYLKLWDPWLFTPIMELLGRIPVKEKMSDIIPRAIIASNNKRLSQIPANNKNIEIGNKSFNGLSRLALRQGNRYMSGLVNRPFKKLSGRDLISRDYIKDYQRIMVHTCLTDIQDTLEQCHDGVMGELIDEKAVAVAVDAMVRGDSLSGHLVTNLLCVNKWFGIIGRSAKLKN